MTPQEGTKGNHKVKTFQSFMVLFSKDRTNKIKQLPNSVYDLRMYFTLGLVEIISSFWEKKNLRQFEIAVFAMIQAGREQVAESATAFSLKYATRLFKRSLTIYLLAVIGLNLFKGLLRLLKNATFTSYGDPQSSYIERRHDKSIPSPDNTNYNQFDSNRSNGTFPKIAKLYYGLTQRLVNIFIDIYIFSSLLSPVSLLTILSALTVCYVITNTLNAYASRSRINEQQIMTTYTTIKQLIIELQKPNTEEITTQDKIRNYIANLRQDDKEMTVADLLSDNLNEIETVVSKINPDNLNEKLEECNQHLSTIAAKRSEQFFFSKAIETLSDLCNKVVEKVFFAFMILLYGKKVIRGDMLETMVTANIVWLNATLKSASDGYKTFFGYVNAIRDYQKMEDGLNIILETFSNKDDVKSEINNLQPTYIQNTRYRYAFYALVASAALGLSLNVPMIGALVLLQPLFNPAATLLALAAGFLYLRSTEGNTVAEKVANVDGSLLQFIGLILLASYAFLSLQLISSLPLLNILTQQHLVFYHTLKSLIPFSTTLVNSALVSSYVVFTYIAAKSIHLFDRYAFQNIAFCIDIISIFFSQLCAQLCWLFPPPSPGPLKVGLMVASKATIYSALTLIITGLILFPGAFPVILTNTPVTTWLTCLLFPILQAESMTDCLKNMPSSLYLITVYVGVQFSRLYLPFLSLSLPAATALGSGLLSCFCIEKYIRPSITINKMIDSLTLKPVEHHAKN